MDTTAILHAIDSQIARLQEAKALLSGGDSVKRHTTRPQPVAASFSYGANASKARKGRKLSAAGRARIAAAQKARWAKVRAGKK